MLRNLGIGNLRQEIIVKTLNNGSADVEKEIMLI